MQLEKHGSDCAWWVDPSVLNSEAIVYSFGLGEDISFELSIISKFNIDVWAYDPTPRSIAWVRRQNIPKELRVNPVGIANYDGSATFYEPANIKNVSHSIINTEDAARKSIEVSVRRLSSFMKENGHSKIDILKMDVEGAEYDVIEDLLSSGIRPYQLLVEFHHRFPAIGIMLTKKAISALHGAGYVITYVSPNGEEFSFVWRPGDI